MSQYGSNKIGFIYKAEELCMRYCLEYFSTAS